MESAWDRIEDTDVERSAGSIVRLPLPPPPDCDDDIDLDAPTMPRTAIWSPPGPVVSLARPVAPRWAMLALAVLAVTAAALALTVAFG